MMNFDNVKDDWQGIDLNIFNIEETIEKYKGKFKVTGTNVAVLIYKPLVQDKIGSLILADVSKEMHLEYTSPIGLVLQVGPEAYEGSQFPSGPYCKEGDWVVIPRASSLTYRYGNEPIAIIDDHKIKTVLYSPEGFRK